MVGCWAVNCYNRSERKKLHYRFPTDATRRALWAKNVGRKTPPTPNSRLCQDHFEADQFEIVTLSGQKRLKRNAIPTVFAHLPPKKRIATSNREITHTKPPPPTFLEKIHHDHGVYCSKPKKRTRAREDPMDLIHLIEQDLQKSRKENPEENEPPKSPSRCEIVTRSKAKVCIPLEETSTVPSESAPSTSEPDGHLPPKKRRENQIASEESESFSSISVNYFRANEYGPGVRPAAADTTSREVVVSPLKAVKTLTAKSCQTDLIVRSAADKLNIHRMMNRINQLKAQLRKTKVENQSLKRESSQLTSIFNKDQIAVLSRKSPRGSIWSPQTLQTAKRLQIACGSSGYEELLNIGFPLPGLRTLRRKKDAILAEACVLSSHDIESLSDKNSEDLPETLAVTFLDSDGIVISADDHTVSESLPTQAN